MSTGIATGDLSHKERPDLPSGLSPYVPPIIPAGADARLPGQVARSRPGRGRSYETTRLPDVRRPRLYYTGTKESVNRMGIVRGLPGARTQVNWFRGCDPMLPYGDAAAIG